MFELFDDEGTGKIGFKQLKRVVTELGESLSDDEMREMIEEADRYVGTGCVPFPLPFTSRPWHFTGTTMAL